jgi:hypothetical protein
MASLVVIVSNIIIYMIFKHIYLNNIYVNKILIIFIEMNTNELETGDLLLVTDVEYGIFNYFLSMIRWATHSNYVHIGMVVREPPFLRNPQMANHWDKSPIYVWESGFEGTFDPEDNEIKLGVQLTPLSIFTNKYNSKEKKVIVRRLNNNKNIFTNNVLNSIHNVVHNKPYDLNPLDWINALTRKDIKPQKTTRFWCSALVGYFYTMAGILAPNTDWSILRPSDFSLDAENLEYSSINTLKPSEILLNV